MKNTLLSASVLALVACGGPPKMETVTLAGRAIAFPVGAKPDGNGFMAKHGDITYSVETLDPSVNVRAAKSSGDAQLIGQTLLEQMQMKDAQAGRGSVEKVNGHHVVSFEIDGAGPRGRAFFTLVDTFGGTVAVVCATKGGLGVGKRIQQMRGTCESIVQSLTS